MNQEKKTLRIIGQSIQHRSVMKRYSGLVDETIEEIKEKLETLRNWKK